jgi:hypothetical protein
MFRLIDFIAVAGLATYGGYKLYEEGKAAFDELNELREEKRRTVADQEKTNKE